MKTESHRLFKLAILDAVPLELAAVDNRATDGEKFQQLLCDDKELLAELGIRAEATIYHVTEHEWPENLACFDGVLISGSPASVHDKAPWIEKLSAEIIAAHKRQQKLIGVCFGHQLIAKTLGGTVSSNPEDFGWCIGNHSLIFEAPPHFLERTTAPLKTTIQHFNKERVTALPKDAEHYLSHPELGIMGYTVGNHIFTVQGHPEQPASAIENFLHYVAQHSDNPEEMLAMHLPNVERDQAEQTLWARWMWQFLCA